MEKFYLDATLKNIKENGTSMVKFYVASKNMLL
jgi:hypothetical protein